MGVFSPLYTRKTGSIRHGTLESSKVLVGDDSAPGFELGLPPQCRFAVEGTLPEAHLICFGV